jgi:2-polyprenyl-3-methyl-5-hydroxy-6-metoxy-1,4-benzoquinol methylase
MNKLEYGTREWLDKEYERVGGDPWGLDWRPSQIERYHPMIDVVRAQPGVDRVKRVLDYGCATGTFTAMLSESLAENGAEVRGSDVAELAISRARARFPRVPFDCLSLEQAEQRFAGSLDLVTMLEVLYYPPKAERPGVLQRVRRMLRPGGMLIVSAVVAYLSLAQLRSLVSTSFRVVNSGALTLKPLSMIEKPILRAARLASRWRPWNPRTRLPRRGRAVGALARLAEKVLGEHAVSHCYVVAVADEGDRKT